MKTIKFIGLGIVAALMGIAAMCVAIAFDASDRVAIVSYFGVAAPIAIALGVFDMPARKQRGRFDSIRHYNGRRNYGQAAVFIGTACLFMGTPKQCEDVCDNLWHYGQQADVRMLTGEETTFEIL